MLIAKPMKQVNATLRVTEMSIVETGLLGTVATVRRKTNPGTNVR